MAMDGYDIDDEGIREFRGFAPCRHELLILLKHWIEVSIDITFFWFCGGLVNSSNHRNLQFATKRISKITYALNDVEANTKTLKNVEEAYGKGVDPLAWKVFTGNASPEEKAAFEEEQKRNGC
jgi:hypothetical protein